MTSRINKEKITCWVCFELFIEPLTLPCNHTFCQACITSIYQIDQACPFCRRIFGQPFPPVNRHIELSVHQYREQKALKICTPQKQNQNRNQNHHLLLSLLPQIAAHYLSDRELLNLSLSCKTFFQAIHSNSLLWREKCQARFPFSNPQQFQTWKNCYLHYNKIQFGWDKGKSGDFKVTTLRGHSDQITCFQNHNDVLISGGADRAVHIWRMGQQRSPHISLDCESPVKNLLALPSHLFILTEHDLQCYDTENYESQFSLPVTQQNCPSLLVTDNRLCYLESPDRVNIVCIDTLQHSTSVSFDNLNGQHITKLYSNPNMERITAILSNSVRMYDLRMPNHPYDSFTLEGPVTRSLVLPQETILLGQSDGKIFMLDRNFVLSEVYTPPHRHYPHNHSITALASDSSHLAWGTADGDVHVLQHFAPDGIFPGKKNPLHSFPGLHQGGVNDLSIHNRKIISCGKDRAIHVSNIQNGRSLYTFLGGSLQNSRVNSIDNILCNHSNLISSSFNLIRIYDFII